MERPLCRRGPPRRLAAPPRRPSVTETEPESERDLKAAGVIMMVCVPHGHGEGKAGGGSRGSERDPHRELKLEQAGPGREMQ